MNLKTALIWGVGYAHIVPKKSSAYTDFCRSDMVKLPGYLGGYKTIN